MKTTNTIALIIVIYFIMAFIELNFNPIDWGWWIRSVFAALVLIVITPSLIQIKREVYVIQHPQGEILAIFKNQKDAATFTSKTENLITNKIKIR